MRIDVLEKCVMKNISVSPSFLPLYLRARSTTNPFIAAARPPKPGGKSADGAHFNLAYRNSFLAATRPPKPGANLADGAHFNLAYCLTPTIVCWLVGKKEGFWLDNGRCQLTSLLRRAFLGCALGQHYSLSVDIK